MKIRTKLARFLISILRTQARVRDMSKKLDVMKLASLLVALSRLRPRWGGREEQELEPSGLGSVQYFIPVVLFTHHLYQQEVAFQSPKRTGFSLLDIIILVFIFRPPLDAPTKAPFSPEGDCGFVPPQALLS